MDHNTSFEELIQKDRNLHQSRSWRGNLLGYLDKVKEDPTIAKLAHARLYDVIMKAGVKDINVDDDPRAKRIYKDESIKIYDFFADEFFGIEKTVSQIVRYFHAASLKGKKAARSCT
jgi:serine protein kinase